MPQAVTHNISVQVEPRYHVGSSKPTLDRYVFAYRVTITNHSDFEVQLHSRHWFIFDGDGTIREVKGDGVVGEQPTISPGESFAYVSWCPLSYPIGKMEGTYTLIRLVDRFYFEVIIPTFELVADIIKN